MTPNDTDKHPNPEQLRQLSHGLYSAAEADPLKRHIAGCSACARALTDIKDNSDQFLPRLSAAGAPTSSLPRSLREPAQEQLGDYRLVRELGRGGMGIVYEAEQLSLRRRVALKVLSWHGGAEPLQLERFLREARAAASLHHTNIVPVFEVGQENDHGYYAMQLIAGQSLDRILTRLFRLAQGWPDAADAPHLVLRQSDWRQAAELGMQAAEALAYAHSRGIVHRDIKPGNLLLDEAGCLWITDFGLARTSEATLTRPGDLVGTLRYLAPERFDGQCDERSDIYALGLTLYEMVTLSLPFEDAESARLVELIRSGEPLRPRLQRPEIPVDLETIILKAIDREPPRRYQTAGELADDLRRFLDGRPIAARPANRLQRVLKVCRRHPLVTGLVVALVLVTLLGLAGITWKYLEADAQRDRADRKAVDAGRAERLALQQAADAERERDRAEWLLYAGRLQLTWRDWDAGKVKRARLWLGDCPEAVRHWEYDYLHRLTGRNPTARNPDIGSLHSLSLSRDGKRLALAGSAGKALLVDPYTGKTQLTLPLPPRWHQRVSLSADGAKLATLSWPDSLQGGQVTVWDAATGRPLIRVPPRDFAHDMQLSPDGRQLACVTSTEVVRVLDAVTGRESATLKGHVEHALACCFTADGTQLATAARDGKVRLWDTARFEEVRHFGDLGSPLIALAVSPDGLLVAAGDLAGVVQVWDARTGQRRHLFTGQESQVVALAFSADSRWLAAGGTERLVRVWDMQQRSPRASLRRGLESMVGGLVFLPGSRRLLCAGYDWEWRSWDVAGNEAFKELAFFHTPQRCAVAADGKKAALSYWYAQRPGDQAISATVVLDLDTGQQLWRDNHPAAEETRVGFHPDGARLLVGRPQGGLELRDATTGRVLHRYGDDRVTALSYRQAGREVAVWTVGGVMRLRDTDSGDERASWRLDEAFAAVAFSPDGERLLLADAQGRVTLRDTATGKLLHELSGLRKSVTALAASADGRWVAAASNDTNALIWDAATGRQQASLRGHTRPITQLVFSRDGERIVTGALDKTATLWRTRTGQLLLTLPEHGNSVTGVAFAAGERLLVTTSHDGKIRLWDAGK